MKTILTEDQVQLALLQACRMSVQAGYTKAAVPSGRVATFACPAGYPDQRQTLRILHKLKAEGIAEQIPGTYHTDRAYSLWWHTSVPKPQRPNPIPA
jgi:hypothetical protein